ncbi:hypothetical protein B5E84_16105 [Lachnoclostridium sp. An14]|nr:hypothetical protein B5E84_16105 [Lachnoclostridium sp. An14]
MPEPEYGRLTIGNEFPVANKKAADKALSTAKPSKKKYGNRKKAASLTGRVKGDSAPHALLSLRLRTMLCINSLRGAISNTKFSKQHCTHPFRMFLIMGL